MSLLLLLKPHPRRAGRGQQLVRRKSAGQEEDLAPDITAAQIDGGPVVLVPSAERIIKASPYFIGRSEEAKQFKQIYKQGLQEGLTIEEMLLLFMMTER